VLILYSPAITADANDSDGVAGKPDEDVKVGDLNAQGLEDRSNTCATSFVDRVAALDRTSAAAVAAPISKDDGGESTEDESREFKLHD
jgi:hypothetical protein